MIRHLFFVTTLMLIFNTLSAQYFSKCYEKYRKNPDGYDSIYIKTCYFNKYKFINTGYPDYKGRYSYYKYDVYVLVNKKYIKTINSKIFNKGQQELLSIINNQIQRDFNEMSSDTLNEDCFFNLKSIPIYKMNDLKISFQNNEIWFGVKWDLSSACLAVSGTAVPFKLGDIQKYLK